MIRRLEADELRATCDPARLPFRTTDELVPLEGVIGQERAMEATAFGIGMKAFGYNVFAVGPSAVGKSSMLRTLIERAAAKERTPSDWCYVHNFTDAYRPRALSLPAGRARELRDALAKTVATARDLMTKYFDSDEYAGHASVLSDEEETKVQAIAQQLDELAKGPGFIVVRSAQGFTLVPRIDDRAMTPAEVEKLSDEQRDEIKAQADALESEFEPIMRSLRQIERDAEEAQERLVRENAANTVHPLFEALAAKFDGIADARAHIASVEKDLVGHAERFMPREEEDEDDEDAEVDEHGDRPTDSSGRMREPPSLRFLERYRVSLVVDRGGRTGAPVVFETSPTYQNLFGRIEHRAQLGAVETDFTLVKGGALHEANGGYLVLEAKDVFEDEDSWGALKKALKNRTIRIEPPSGGERGSGVASLSPEPIPLDVKLVLMGPSSVYYPLFVIDEDFRDLFKVKVEFEESFPRAPETELLVARFVAAAAKENGLRPFSAEAVAKLVEHGSRLVSHQARVSARLGELVDLLREADFWAGHRGRSVVGAEELVYANAQKVRRSSMAEEHLRRATNEGEILLDVTGASIGQVNGIAVLSTGDHSFGRTCRITARVHAGKPGVVDVEREAGLGGAIHSKGVMLITGYLAGRFARGHRLAMSAWLAFEQSYDEVDGDSASCAELCALMSALSGVPLDQGYALTGSVNQLGQVQPVGGINEKIEGFFDLCQDRGLSRKQGVLIPAANVRHLLLRDDVVAAVRERRFEVIAVSHIDEALSLLTGREPGERDAGGHFPPGTLNALVEDTLIGWGAAVPGIA